jgi:hypothetical protein
MRARTAVTFIATALSVATACKGRDAGNANVVASGSASPTANSITFDGLPRFRIGATTTQLAANGDTIPPVSGEDVACHLVRLPSLPTGARLMLMNDSLARIDIDSTSEVKTVDGAGIGDSEARVAQLYGARLVTQPHKYEAAGHYLIVTDQSDTLRRLVFETDGKTVRSFRVGRRPAIDYVEACG